MKLINSFLKDESGAGAIEYALIIGLIGLAIIAGATLLGGKLNTSFSNTAAKVSSSVAP